jgi:rubrerythrin
MSPSELMIRTIHWVCPCCGEVARTARQPQNCQTCGRTGATSFEQQREVSLPSD